MNMTGMAMGALADGAVSSSAADGVDTASLVLRLVLLLGTAVAAGTAVLRPFVPRTNRRTVRAVAAASLLAAAADVLSLVLLPVSVPPAVFQVLLTLALPVLLARPKASAWGGGVLIVLLLVEAAPGHSVLAVATDTVYVLAAVGWFGLTVLRLTVPGEQWTAGRAHVRPGPAAWAVGGALALAGIVQVAFAGVGLDRRLYGTWFGVLLLLTTVLPLVLAGLVAVLSRTASGRARLYPAGACAVASAFLAWTALGGLPVPGPPPTPGVPLLTRVTLAGKQVPVLVSPQRPGHNLVHLPAGAGAGVSVTTAGGRPVPVTERAGTDGRWAEVALPAGRSELVVAHGTERATVEVDTGSAAGPASATGQDGPECASAALGGLVGGGSGAGEVLRSCPSDTLATEDADALREVVGYLAGRSVADISVAGDGSPRSQQAARTVRAAAAKAHLRVDEAAAKDTAGARHPKGALVIVSGWTDAATRLHAVSEEQATLPTYGAGLYLAPWLVHTPVVNEALTSFLPLRFNPRDGKALNYSITLSRGFDGETASTAGFAQWSAARHESPDEGTAVLYACAQVNAMPMESMGTDMPNNANNANKTADMGGMDMSRRQNSPEDMGMGGGTYPGQWVTGGTVVPVTGPLSS